jgi:hypothetical protein
MFHKALHPLVNATTSITEAALILNRDIWGMWVSRQHRYSICIIAISWCILCAEQPSEFACKGEARRLQLPWSARRNGRMHGTVIRSDTSGGQRHTRGSRVAQPLHNHLDKPAMYGTGTCHCNHPLIKRNCNQYALLFELEGWYS